MELVATLGRSLAFSLAAGLNLYATIAVLGLAAHFHVVALPPQFAAFDHPWIIGIALVLYVVEFVADKVPWVDSLWDSVHTFVRPIGGALIAVSTLGEASPWLQGIAALAGGTLAAGSHVTKAGTRVAANMSPEPFTNWVLSFGEDAFVVGLGLLALKFPVAALVVTLACVFVAVFLMRRLLALIRRAVTPPPPLESASPPGH